MAISVKFNKVISGAVGQILRPLFRVLLRNSLSFNAFVEIAKRVYVEVAMQEAGVPGKKPSISRVSILSGLSRKEIQRVLKTADGHSEPLERYNRAARVIAGWVRDPDFLDQDKNPKTLAPQDEGKINFAELVRRHSGDVPARAMLDELLRVGAVEQIKGGAIRLLDRVYVPRSSELDKLDILGTDVADLISTIDNNLQHSGTDLLFQRKVMYDNLPAEALPKFRSLSGTQAQALLERLDLWLSQHDRDSNPMVTGSGRVRAGIGIYYFEEKLASAPKESSHEN